MSAFYRDPLHRQVENILRDRIGTIYPLGERIPTEVELAREFKVSLQTIRRALGELARQGVIDRRRGSGSYARLAPPPGPVAIVAKVDLSAGKPAYVELRLIDACQAALEEAGREWRLYLGRAGKPEASADASESSLERDLRTVSFSGAIMLSSGMAGTFLMETPGLCRVGRVSEGDGTRVAGNYSGFLKRAVHLLKKAGCEELVLLGGTSAWVTKGENGPPLPALPPWTPESRGWLASYRGKQPVGLIIADPSLVEETLGALAEILPGDRLRVVACGFAGESRGAGCASVCYLDLDLEAVGRVLVEQVAAAESDRGSSLHLVDAWHLAEHHGTADASALVPPGVRTL